MNTTLPLTGRARLRELPTASGASEVRSSAGLSKTTLFTDAAGLHQHETEATSR
ncbi:hypothetical protein ACQPXB_23370 [Amycolatopsis sp. CA-161197]|uniref:hypothetical protein n=1 Tax=Amycolatopsis sp. CA-161197 TaxID=3239922 RepID=UPI003D8F5FF8